MVWTFCYVSVKIIAIMETLHTQGIITHALAFKEYDRIVTLFTPDSGLIKIVVKGAFSQKQAQGASTVPLTCVEVQCTRRQSDLYSCRELEVIDSNLSLRNNLPLLESACEMLQVVMATQQPGKATPELYRLLATYIKRLPEAECPRAISASFKLKTLRYEGLLELPSAPTQELPKEDHDLILALTYSLDFPLIGSLVITSSTSDKINTLFDKFVYRL